LTVLPEALTLDVGHTLLFPDPPLGEMYACKLAGLGVHVQAEWVEENFPRAWTAARDAQAGLVYGTTHKEGIAFWIEVNRRLFTPDSLSAADLNTFVADLYDSYARAENWHVTPALDRLLGFCSELGIPVALVSNWDQRLRGLLTELGLVDRFQALVISAEIGVEKPDPEIFVHALRQLGCSAASTLHVGDSWREDILGAHALGMKALWLSPADTTPPQALPRVYQADSVGTLADYFALAVDTVR
jgi:putative hydrolase of the HAD superfamily